MEASGCFPSSLCVSKDLPVSACRGPRMSQRPGHSSQSCSLLFPSWDQSDPVRHRNPCLFPQLPGDLVLCLRAFFLLSQPLVHLAPAVLEGKGSDLPFQMVALGPHAGGSLARPLLPAQPYSVTVGDCQNQGHEWSFVSPVFLSRILPGAGAVSHMCLT